MKTYHFGNTLYSDAELGYLLFIAIILVAIVIIGCLLLEINREQL